ncbi:MAG TPA: hypothetical protein VNM40_02645 [Candidatus Paceibacterota bacterium]|nr:hypothetical protein [Candidatus Paceibacterota bacterium]
MDEKIVCAGLPLGYTKFGLSTPREERQFLQSLFGDFTDLTLHVEQFSYDTMRVTAEGTLKGLTRIYERFTGMDKSQHRTKNGTWVLLIVVIEEQSATVSLVTRDATAARRPKVDAETAPPPH